MLDTALIQKASSAVAAKAGDPTLLSMVGLLLVIVLVSSIQGAVREPAR
ncbi:MAG: hypothetical protein AAGC77_14330 [Pseudomonadota bacterium]